MDSDEDICETCHGTGCDKLSYEVCRDCDFGTKKGFFLIIQDSCSWFQHSYSSLDDALNELLFRHWNTDKSLGEIKTSDSPFWVFEFMGRLYQDPLGRVRNEYLLFEEYTSEKPKTIAELREYMKSGHTVRIGRSSYRITVK